MYRKNFCEIDLEAIRHNVRVMRGHLAPGVKFLAVVKANAYGHGDVQVAKAALSAGAEFLAVAIPEEGEHLRNAGITAPILVLGGIVSPKAAEADVRLGLVQVVFDEERIRLLSSAGVAAGKEAEVHLGLDTGMCRIGVREPEEAAELAKLIDSLPGIRLTGCFTHMATADEEDVSGTRRQEKRYRELTKAIREAHEGELLCHAANTASLFRYPEFHDGMARGGIALYGCPPVPEAEDLMPAMRWITEAVYVKTIHPGDRVSYGGTFEAKKDTRVMTVPVGYADGYRRGISGKGCVLVCGKRAPILGRICMDQLMADVTDIPGVAVGDEVVLLGVQGDECISAQEMASWIGTIDYEVLCSPSARVPRVWLNE
ncbi:MAG: alanine racemase [Clostridiales bacterium]|nr:alanine racemase [Clostridiales bacterium]